MDVFVVKKGDNGERDEGYDNDDKAAVRGNIRFIDFIHIFCQNRFFGEFLDHMRHEEIERGEWNNKKDDEHELQRGKCCLQINHNYSMVQNFNIDFDVSSPQVGHRRVLSGTCMFRTRPETGLILINKDPAHVVTAQDLKRSSIGGDHGGSSLT